MHVGTSYQLNTKVVASFPGPAQLSCVISTAILQSMKSWAGPGNEATKVDGHQELYLAIKNGNNTNSFKMR